jgi:uncharacterized membrane protein
MADLHGHCDATHRYRATGICPYWEIIVLESRFVTLFIGSFSKKDSLDAALVVFVITLAQLILQQCFKPFRETAEEAAHWSSANRMAVTSYACQLVVLLVGVVSIFLGPAVAENKALSLALGIVAVVALAAPLTLTVMIIRRKAGVYIHTAAAVAVAAVGMEQPGTEEDDGSGNEKKATGASMVNPLALTTE